MYVLSYAGSMKERVQMLKDWHENGGVIITGYEMYRNLVNHNHVRSKVMKAHITRTLADPGMLCRIPLGKMLHCFFGPLVYSDVGFRNFVSPLVLQSTLVGGCPLFCTPVRFLCSYAISLVMATLT